ncbi:MAG: plastocyanin/azurin family copper-binding protein [Pseudomonadota bacterium]|nr:plastocyanin/azurin family copper-binding protein [Pseudomonadota bacterium]
MKRNILFGSAAAAGFMALAACGGGAEAPAEEATAPTEEAAAPAAEEAAPAEEAAEPVPEVEANGTVIEINMYTKDPDDSSALQVFKPRLVNANVGDTIKFIPSDPTHQSSSIDSMVPAGVTGWEGKINEEVSFVIPTTGIYGYKCVPHYAAGMIGMVVVGSGDELTNLEDAKGASHPGLAGREFGEIFEEAGL